MKERKSITQWFKDHKKELVIAGACAGALALIILRIRKGEGATAALSPLKELVRRPPAKPAGEFTRVVEDIPSIPVPEIAEILPLSSPGLPFEVRRHIRNLPKGQHASPEKVATALANNIELMPGQTWVDGYLKRRAAA